MKTGKHMRAEERAQERIGVGKEKKKRKRKKRQEGEKEKPESGCKEGSRKKGPL